jgi:hypothetical protein
MKGSQIHLALAHWNESDIPVLLGLKTEKLSKALNMFVCRIAPYQKIQQIIFFGYGMMLALALPKPD